ncbi:MAG: SprT family zinc-dependent metalloprotease [Bdellovibrionales bacterium]|nr:SprT family zinc-dependent metalloprotease [Bdellovibrionales bacterium]
MHRETIPFQYKNQSFSISLKYSSRKTVGVSVYPDKKIEITAPFGTSFASIQKVVERKSKWIFRQLEELEKYQTMEQKKKYTSGQTLKILGYDYMIKVIQIEDFEEERIIKEKRLIKVYVHNKAKGFYFCESSKKAAMGREQKVIGNFECDQYITQRERISLLIEDWYRNEAMIYLAQKFEQCYERIRKYNIQKPLYYLRYMKQRWGSCTSKGTILLNPECFQLPSHCIEYIITHELCHLKYRNHSKEFYNFLGTVMPNWEDNAQALDSFLQV